MNERLFYDDLYNLLNDLTPLRSDCGLFCSQACCQGDSHQGMLLFPGEDTLYDTGANWFELLTRPDGAKLLVCRGSCPRNLRPLGCRIFPLFPFLRGEQVTVRMDPLATLICPLVDRGGVAGLSSEFVRAVEQVGHILSLQSECRAFLTEQGHARDPVGLFI